MRPDVVLFQETKIKVEDVIGAKKKFGKWQSKWIAVEGAFGGVCVLWKEELECSGDADGRELAMAQGKIKTTWVSNLM